MVTYNPVSFLKKIQSIIENFPFTDFQDKAVQD